MPDNDPFAGDRKELAKTFPARRRRELFIAWYLVFGDGYQAALEAGWPEKTAKQRAYEMLRDPDILAAIRQAQGERSRRVNLTADRVLRELAYVALSNVDNFELNADGKIVPRDDISPSVMRAVKSIKYRTEYTREKGSDTEVEVQTAELTLWNKTEAIKLAMQHMGMLKTQIELTGKDGAPLIPLEAARSALIASRTADIDSEPVDYEIIEEDRQLAATAKAGEEIDGVQFDGDDMVYKGIRASLAKDSDGETFVVTMHHPDAPNDVRVLRLPSGEDVKQKSISEINDLTDLYGAA
jgi:phage terminase small subunit